LVRVGVEVPGPVKWLWQIRLLLAERWSTTVDTLKTAYDAQEVLSYTDIDGKTYDVAIESVGVGMLAVKDGSDVAVASVQLRQV
jgi:hypothetical protein